MNEKLPGLFDCKVRPLTDEESKVFIRISMMEMQGEDALKAMDKTLRDNKVFPYMVMVKRLEAFKEHFSPTLDIDIGAQVFCSMIANSPGKIVMWAHTLNELFVRQGRKVTLSDWTMSFPFGVPNDDEYDRMWELQKSEGDNLIDDFNNWSLPKAVEKA